MPRAPLRPCAHPGCPTLVERGRCSQHRTAVRREHDERRGTASSRLYGYRWQQASQAFLHEHALCYYGRLLGLIEAATCVDHATPHKGDPVLFWDRKNWRSSCHAHNSAKRDDDEPTFLAKLKA